MCTRWRYQWQPQAGTCLLPNFYSFCVCPQKCEVLVLCRRCRPDRALSRAGGAAQSVQQRSLQAGSALSRVRSAAAREREALAGRKQHWQAAALPLCAAQPKHAPAQPVPGPGCRAPVSQRGRARASCQVRHRVTAKPRGHTLFFCPVAACASQQAGALLPRCASDLHGAAGTGSSATPRRRLELTSASRPAARRTKPKGAVHAAPAVRKPAPAGQEGADATNAGSVALLQVHTLPTCSDIGSRSLFAPPPARLGHCLVCSDEKVMCL